MGGGGWVVVYRYILMPLTWPNLQDGTCKNSIQIEFQVGPECGNILILLYLRLIPHAQAFNKYFDSIKLLEIKDEAYFKAIITH